MPAVVLPPGPDLKFDPCCIEVIGGAVGLRY
ncbi:hypothetical protein OKW12_000987 [Pseudomonas silensiensis]|nr:hypothetical protein [Pseudomonas silensiensis]